MNIDIFNNNDQKIDLKHVINNVYFESFKSRYFIPKIKIKNFSMFLNRSTEYKKIILYCKNNYGFRFEIPIKKQGNLHFCTTKRLTLTCDDENLDFDRINKIFNNGINFIITEFIFYDGNEYTNAHLFKNERITFDLKLYPKNTFELFNNYQAFGGQFLLTKNITVSNFINYVVKLECPYDAQKIELYMNLKQIPE